jgi:hypothetical protein
MGFSPVVKRTGSEANHWPPCSAKVKKAWNYTSTPYVFMTLCLIEHADSCTFSRFDLLIETSLMMQIISQKTWLFNWTYTLYLPLPENVPKLYRGCWGTTLFILDLDTKCGYIIMYKFLAQQLPIWLWREKSSSCACQEFKFTHLIHSQSP